MDINNEILTPLMNYIDQKFLELERKLIESNEQKEFNIDEEKLSLDTLLKIGSYKFKSYADIKEVCNGYLYKMLNHCMDLFLYKHLVKSENIYKTSYQQGFSTYKITFIFESMNIGITVKITREVHIPEGRCYD